MAEVDWKKVFRTALIGDAFDFFIEPIPIVGKVLGDVIDVTYTLPRMRKELPEIHKDKAYFAALGEVIPLIELLPNWLLLATSCYLKEKKGAGEKTTKHKTIFEELELPSLEEFFSPLKEKKERS